MAQVREAFHKLAMKHHPDREGGSKTKFVEIQKAADAMLQRVDPNASSVNMHWRDVHNWHYDAEDPPWARRDRGREGVTEYDSSYMDSLKWAVQLLLAFLIFRICLFQGFAVLGKVRAWYYSQPHVQEAMRLKAQEHEEQLRLHPPEGAASRQTQGEEGRSRPLDPRVEPR